MRILDLYCCAGGSGRGYSDAGFEVYGIDIAPQPNYPYPFFQGDALLTMAALLMGAPIRFCHPDGRLEVMYLSDFDAIHASPPCQSYLSLGKVNKALGRAYEYPNLIGPTRKLLIESGLPYVIENVSDARAELIEPVRICGTALGLPLRRHRLFESSVPITGLACAHHRFTEKRYWTSWRPKGEVRLSTVVQVYGNGGNQHEWPAAMGIDWMTPHEMAEAIPPAYTKFIGLQLLRDIEMAA